MSEAWSYENSNGEKQCKSCEEWKLISLFVGEKLAEKLTKVHTEGTHQNEKGATP